MNGLLPLPLSLTATFSLEQLRRKEVAGSGDGANRQTLESLHQLAVEALLLFPDLAVFFSICSGS